MAEENSFPDVKTNKMIKINNHFNCAAKK